MANHTDDGFAPRTLKPEWKSWTINTWVRRMHLILSSMDRIEIEEKDREVPRRATWENQWSGKLSRGRWELNRSLNEFIVLKRRRKEKETYCLKDGSKYVTLSYVSVKSFIFLRKLSVRIGNFSSLILLDNLPYVSGTVLGTGGKGMAKAQAMCKAAQRTISATGWNVLHRGNDRRGLLTHRGVSVSL